MTADEALDSILPLFSRYYDITREDVFEPYTAEAAFHSNESQYFLFKEAKYYESEAHEYLFFRTLEHLTLEEAERLAELSWNEGLRRARPNANHRSTDVGLILLADRVDPDAAEYIKKVRRSKSYRFLLQGYSNFRTIAIETSTGAMSFNRMGGHWKKLFSNINF